MQILAGGQKPETGLSGRRAPFTAQPTRFWNSGELPVSPFVFDFHYFLRMINLAGAVSIGTMQQGVVMNGAITVSEKGRNK